MRSLTVKVSLAFLGVSLAGVALVAVSVWSFSSAEFDRLLADRAQSSFVTAAAAYYEAQGTWDGLAQLLREEGLILPGREQPAPGVASVPTPVFGRRDGDQRFPAPSFGLADQSGMVVVAGGPYHLGDRVPTAQLASGKAVTVNGQVVGTVLMTGIPPQRNPLEERYLARINRAIVIAALGATGFALLLGILLARTIARPVRELTAAARAMAQGQLKQQVPVRSRDELGELTRTFNQMSADLAMANHLRKQMTADIAHDLRNPLMVITGYLESMREGALPPTPERIDTIHREARLLQRLVEDLRTLSLADAGELTLNRTRLCTPALLERLTEAYRLQAEQNRIALRAEVGPDLPEVEADEERLAQVLNNLVANALRYTPAGGEIVLSARSQAGALALTVQDNGRGIEPEALPHIFDRFYRGDEARAESDGESGLGLAIAKSIVEAHHGTIAATSVPGHCTTFTVTLPAAGKA